MKTRHFLFCLIIFIITLASCKPEEQPPTISYVFSDVSVDEGQTSATITCRNESVDDDKVHASVLLSKNENVTNATKYPLSLQNDTLRTTISGLEENTMYYFCFEVYTANEHKRTEEVHHFETKGGGSVTVTTSEAINVTQTTATGGGSVIADGNYTVSMRGVCWDTIPNPNALQSPHLVSGQGTGTFLVNITNLKPYTQYYMKAYAVCNDVVYYGDEVVFVTLQTNSYNIGVSANPSEGGTATGGGTFQQGQECTINAVANNGYTFVNWTENGNQVSANANYTFTVNANRTLVANFTATSQNYTISVSATPSEGGTATGGGTYDQDQSCTVIATAANGYRFTNWTEDGNEVSTNANYTFNVTSNRTLVAHFEVQAPNTYTINASPNPSTGGTVTGGGTYQQGQSCTVTATANTGYTFLRWTENGNQVSTNASYTFQVTGNRTLVAQFQANTYTISVSADPSDGGTVNGGGNSFTYNQSCTVTATAKTGYTFLQWTENGNQVSTNTNYTFTVTDNRTLVAQFQQQSYTISVSANPTNGGSVTGGGNYNYGQSCTLQATAATGYTFTNWTENGSVLSTSANYTFTVTSNRTLVANFTATPQNYTISVSANPSNGGSVSGGGTYAQGQSCTISAIVNNGYTFTNWTENGSVVSTNASYTFTVTNNRTLVANFTANPQNYTISVSANPSNGGSVSGGGTYQQGQSCTVTATANNGYTFTNWTENGSQVSTNSSYSFTVNSNRTLVANFTAVPQAPTGAINGLFSVSASQQVWFSQGNLQYIGSAGTPYWKFAENQWDYFGTTTGQNSSNHNVDRDLFGWGTSGWYNGSTYYMPFDVEDAYPADHQYGPPGEYDLTGEYANADWGVYNPISNGGNVAGQWRTLTHSEWGYVLFSRTTPSGIRFAKAVVNDVNGVIVLPDDWVGSIYTLSSINNREANYNNNIISASNWTNVLQAHGAVFLPAGGSRAGTSVLYAGTNGYYWSSSYYNPYQSKSIFFSNTQLKIGEPDLRYCGCSVRLVQDQ